MTALLFHCVHVGVLVFHSNGDPKHVLVSLTAKRIRCINTPHIKRMLTERVWQMHDLFAVERTYRKQFSCKM
jgi:hypothetical protein